MKKRKLLCLVMAILFAITLVACQAVSENQSGNESQTGESVELSDIISFTEEQVIITVSSSYMEITQTTTLKDYMSKLKADGGFDYTEKDGIITSINGKANAPDWSACWMLYTSDGDFKDNSEWGTQITVGETTCYSAVLGYASLPITDGCIYVWNYDKF